MIIGAVFAVLSIVAWIVVGVVLRIHRTHKNFTDTEHEMYMKCKAELEESSKINRFVYVVLMDLITSNDGTNQLHRLANLRYMLLMSFINNNPNTLKYFYDGLKDDYGPEVVQNIYEALEAIFTSGRYRWVDMNPNAKAAFDKFVEDYAKSHGEAVLHNGMATAYAKYAMMDGDSKTLFAAIDENIEDLKSKISADYKPLKIKKESDELLEWFESQIDNLPEEEEETSEETVEVNKEA